MTRGAERDRALELRHVLRGCLIGLSLRPDPPGKTNQEVAGSDEQLAGRLGRALAEM